MAIPNGAGGYQIGDGNLTESLMTTQTAPAAYTASATLVPSDLVNGIITLTNGSDQNLQLPLAADVDAAIPSAKVNSAIQFSVMALGAGGATLTTNTGWSLVGVAKVTAQNRYTARKTGDGTWSLYQIA